MKHRLHIALSLLLAAFLGACSKSAVYQTESFEADSPYKLKVKDEVATACESARRALLGQGYLVEQKSQDQVTGRKAYRRSGDLNTYIEMNVVCAPDRRGSTVFANGLLSTYDLKKGTSSASVGVSAIGSISLPIGQSADSLVKVGEETIEDKAFYGRFFAAVSYLLKEMGVPAESEQPAAAAMTSEAPESAIPIEQGPAQAAPSKTEAPAPARAEPAPAVPAPAASPPPDPVPAPDESAPAPAGEPGPATAPPAAEPAPKAIGEGSSTPGTSEPAPLPPATDSPPDARLQPDTTDAERKAPAPGNDAAPDPDVGATRPGRTPPAPPADEPVVEPMRPDTATEIDAAIAAEAAWTERQEPGARHAAGRPAATPPGAREKRSTPRPSPREPTATDAGRATADSAPARMPEPYAPPA